MQPMTDEQYRTIATAIRQTGYLNNTTEENLLAEGRAAMKVTAPYHLAEPTNDEMRGCGMCTDDCCAPNFRQVFAERLAQYTVKPDPRRYAVAGILHEFARIFERVSVSNEPKVIKEYTDKLFAAIDAAGGKQ